ncbi:MAG: hypothetical protein DMG46_19230 [Acidobacteria bacterium]|nr:MAG: hypothetical protein DMG46_19230 [Acidobacteriota bacterium]
MEFGYPSVMDPIITGAIPVLPAADTTNYAGINRGEAYLHIAGMRDKELARKVGDQTMVRIAVQGLRPCMRNIRNTAEKCTLMVRCKPSPGGRKSSARLTPTGCA